MRLNHYLLLLLSLFSTHIFSQDAKLTGKVTEENGDALISANVVIDASKGWAAVTDFDGNYEITIPAGSYEVSFRYIGKNEIKQKITLAAGEHRVLNIKMIDQQQLMNEVVVSGSKYEKKLSEETVTLDVVQGNALANQNITSLDQGMSKVPGVTIADGQVNIRGGAGWSYGAGSRVQVLQDDLPLLAADAATAQWGIIPMENVSQVEVIKGAASALYGSGALDGVVNIRTAYPVEDSTYFKVTTYGGLVQAPTISPDMDWWGNMPRYGTGGSFAYRQKFGQSDFVLGGAYDGSNGYLDSSGEQQVRLNFKYRYRFKNVPGLNMGVNGSGQYDWGQTFFFYNGLDTAGYKPYPGTITDYKDRHFTLDPFLNYYDKNDNEFKFLSRYMNLTNTNNTGQGSVSDLYYTELQYLKKIQVKAFDLHFIAGTVNQYKTVNAPAGATNSLFGENNEYDFSAYAQADFKFFKKLNVSIGARWEYIKQWHYAQDSTSPGHYFQKLDTVQNSLKQLPYPLFRLGLNYQVAEATFLRASLGQGFRYPSIAERYIATNVGPLGIYSNPDLNPEKGYSAEVAVRQGFKLGSWTGYGDLSGFLNEYQNMMEFTFGQFGAEKYWSISDPGASAHDYGFGFASQNIGQTRILGTEFELGTQGKIGPVDVQIVAGYTYLDPKSLDWNDTLSLYNYQGIKLTSLQLAHEAYNPNAYNPDPAHGAITYGMTSSSNSNILKYTSPHLLKVDITLDYKGFEYNTNLQYNSFQQNIDYAFVSPLFRLIGPEAFNALAQYRNMQQDIPIGKGRGDIVWNMSIAYKLKMGLRFGFIVNNVLNWEYTPRPAYFETPRNYTLQLSYTLQNRKHKSPNQ